MFISTLVFNNKKQLEVVSNNRVVVNEKIISL